MCGVSEYVLGQSMETCPVPRSDGQSIMRRVLGKVSCGGANAYRYHVGFKRRRRSMFDRARGGVL